MGRLGRLLGACALTIAVAAPSAAAWGRARIPGSLLPAIAKAPCACVLEVEGVDHHGDTIGVCRLRAAGVCPAGPVHLLGSRRKDQLYGMSISGFVKPLPGRAAGPGIEATGAVVLAGLAKTDGQWGFAWHLYRDIDSGAYVGDWLYLLPTDDPADVVTATRLLRAATQGQLSAAQWTTVERIIARTRSPTALLAALGTIGSRGGPTLPGCPEEVVAGQKGLQLPPLTDAQVRRRCASFWRLTSPAARSRILWLLNHPSWLERRVPLQCSAAHFNDEPHQCRLGARSVWTPMTLVRAALAPDHRSGEIPALPGVPSPRPPSWTQQLAKVGRALGMRSVPPDGPALKAWPKAALRRLYHCYLGQPAYGPPDEHLPARCPLGHVRLGLVYVDGRGWVVDRPGAPWPGQKPWSHRKRTTTPP